jgi:hypothetical protein
LAIGRGFLFDFRHLFSNLKLKDGQFSASSPLLSQFYTDFCQTQSISVPFDQLPNNFALHCLERLLLDSHNLDSIDVIGLVTEAKKQKNFALIRRVSTYSLKLTNTLFTDCGPACKQRSGLVGQIDRRWEIQRLDDRVCFEILQFLI